MRIDLLGLGCETIHQGGIAKDIDRPWYSAARVGDHIAGFVGKELIARSNSAETIIDILFDVVRTQGPKVIVRRYPLRKLQQLWRAQHVLQLRLSDQDYLKKLTLVGIDVH